MGSHTRGRDNMRGNKDKTTDDENTKERTNAYRTLAQFYIMSLKYLYFLKCMPVKVSFVAAVLFRRSAANLKHY